MRRTLALPHRWTALAAGLLLALLGLTGSVMVWQAEIDAALNPRWFAAPAGAQDPCAEVDRPVAATLEVLRRTEPHARAAIVLAPARPGAAYQVWEPRDPVSGLRREHFIDADCEQYLGSRLRGAWRLDRAHAVPLLYELHSKLLAGETGHLAAGAGALVLLALALSGLWVAWPPRSSAAGWRRALSIRGDASRQRLWYDVHRALGLWLLPLTLLMSLTGAALVFEKTARAVVASVLPVDALPRPPRAPRGDPTMAPALPAPDLLVARAGERFPRARWSRLTLPTGNGTTAEVRLLQPGEPRADTGSTRVRFDAAGQIAAVHDPLRTAAGGVLLDWVFPLHSGEALGLAARLLWTAFGLLPGLLLASGLWLWWRRTRQRQAARHTPGPVAAGPANLPLPAATKEPETCKDPTR
jgi:uncharacterized iron-regulated membrane protein